MLAWLLPLVWAGVIWLLGSGSFSQPETSRILGPLFAWLLPFVSESVRTEWVGLVRKSAHLVEYGLLAVLLLHPITLTITRRPARIASIVLATTAVLAGADEFRQTQIASRTGTVADALLDIAGAAAALTLAFILLRLRRPHSPPPQNEAQ